MSQSTSSHSATSLVMRLQQQDSIAWEQLVEMYGPLIFHWCSRCGLDEADAADLIQEVFSAVANSIHRFERRPGATLRSWLWKITQNRIRDLYRRREHQVQAVGGTAAQIRVAELADGLEDDSHLELTSDVESKRLVNRALKLIRQDFQETTWQAFWRSAVENHDTKWIAEDLGMSPNSVRQAKSRVLRRLREQLGDL